MNGPTTKELVARSVSYARYFKRRAHSHTDPKEIARLTELSNHNLQLARHIKAAAIKTGSYA